MTANSETILSTEFSIAELWFLLSQFGPAVVVGIDNPYLGWLMEEIEAASRAALASLVDRDLVRQVSEKEIAFDEVLAAMVSVCAHAEHSLIVQEQRAGGNGARRYVHFANGLIVEHAEYEPGRHRLTAIRDKQALAERLRDVLRPDSAAAGRAGKFALGEAVLFEARALCEQGETSKAVARLVHAGLAPELAERLGRALSSPVANSSVVVVVNRADADSQHVRGFAMLEGNGEMWLMRPYDRRGEAWVEFSPADAAQAGQRFLEVLP